MTETLNEQVQDENTNGTLPADNTQQPVVEDIVIPDNWEPDVKDFITSIQDQAGKKAIFEKLSNYEKGYTKKYQDVAAQRKELENDRYFIDTYRGFEKTIDPQIAKGIVAQYGSMPNYYKALHELDVMASTDPESFLVRYCQSNGITNEKLQEVLSGKKSQEYSQQRSQEMLETQIMQKLEAKMQAEKWQNEVLSFANAKNEQGELAHPHLDVVGSYMDALAQANPNASLEDLYNMAVYAHPELREEVLRRDALKFAQQNEVEKAKAIKGIKPSIPAVNSQEKRNWKESLNELLPINS